MSKRFGLFHALASGSKGRTSNQVLLMGLDYRLLHAAAIFSLGALLLTGNDGRGGPLLTFHIDFGLLCGGVLAVYCLVLVSKHRVKLFNALRNPINAQMDEGFAVLSRYLFGTQYPPQVKSRMGRHNILATYASLVLALSFIPLTFGGVMMLFLQRGTLEYEEMKILHLFGVGLIALFFLVHFFAVINPENKPLLSAIFLRGHVSLEWAKEHIPAFIKDSESQE